MDYPVYEIRIIRIPRSKISFNYEQLLKIRFNWNTKIKSQLNFRTIIKNQV